MAENKKLITADNSFLTYMGRIDFSDKTRPEFYYAGSNVKMTFTGTSVSLSFSKRPGGPEVRRRA